jgi:hypothetical protein
MKIRFGGPKDLDRQAEPFSTRLLLILFFIAVVNCVLLLRTTGPPGYEQSLPMVSFYFYVFLAVCSVLIWAIQVMRATKKASTRPSHYQTKKLHISVTLGDSLLLFMIAGVVVLNVMQWGFNAVGTLH